MGALRGSLLQAGDARTSALRVPGSLVLHALGVPESQGPASSKHLAS